ncbi:MAG TPA: family 2A encapsulin nanocompartment cargo protein cysteine desulfurase [Vicinamibacteria bacterium]|nr:family 2A encapsulin nanocompartment cargo protein cysteine desulfurase [Vicinamibacteria bacterium]
MSTSDPSGGAGPLDPEILARLASEMFRAMPGSGATPEPSLMRPASPGLPPSAAPAHLPGGRSAGSLGAPIEIPGEAHLHSLLAGLAPAAAAPHMGAAPGPIPVGGSPSFYFLEYVRPVAAGGLAAPGFPADPVVPGSSAPGAGLDVELIRRDFPILEERVHGRRLVWLDNAATTQKPKAVIDRLRYFYEHENSNIHRAAHELAARSTDAYEDAREKVKAFLNAATKDEIVYVRGGTEAINLVAQAWGRKNVGKGDEIVITWLEHHANIVPWFRLCEETGARLRVAPVDDRGQVILDEYARLLGPRTKLVSLAHVSNALGTVTPAQQMVAMAHAAGALALVDGAQAVSHMPVDVQSLGCDFYVFSGHKVFAPTGIGALYGRKSVLDEMDPYQGGGNMIQDVTFEEIRYQGPPARFEAGTPSIADAVGLGAALAYVGGIGMPAIAAYEHALLEYATRLLETVPGLRIIGTAAEKASVLSFVLQGHEVTEVGRALDREGIAVRAGHHCAQPILRRFGLEATVRPSLAFYNNRADVDALVAALLRLTRRKPISSLP